MHVCVHVADISHACKLTCPREDHQYGNTSLQRMQIDKQHVRYAKAMVSRGGQSMKSFTTTNLVVHLQKHPAEHKKYEDEKTKQSSCQKSQEEKRL